MTKIASSKKDATIRTIANIAGVSHTTVSRALNDSLAVKMATKFKIKKIAEQLGYVPNINAKGLASQRTYLIGVFFTSLDVGTSDSFLSDVVHEIYNNLPSEYSISINSMQDGDRSSAVQKFDGALVVSQAKSDDRAINEIFKRNLPMVVLNRPIDRRDVPNIIVDEYVGSKAITDYEIRLGHKDFGLIRGEKQFASSHERERGFRDALAEHGLTVNPMFIADGNYLPKSGYAAMREILSSSLHPTCVFCSNDEMAIGAIRACSDLGYRVPEDISISGYDDTRYSKYLLPALTTVNKPTELIARKGIKLLTKMLKGELPVRSKVRDAVEPIPIIRNSVVDLRNK